MPKSQMKYCQQASLDIEHLRAYDVEVTLDHLQLFLLLVASGMQLLDLNYVLLSKKRSKNKLVIRSLLDDL